MRIDGRVWVNKVIPEILGRGATGCSKYEKSMSEKLR